MNQEGQIIVFQEKVQAVQDEEEIYADQDAVPIYEDENGEVQIQEEQSNSDHLVAEFHEVNQQHNMENLLGIIDVENKSISEKTNLSQQWSMILFYQYKWSRSECYQKIDEKNTHLEKIHYNKIFKSKQKSCFKVLPVAECMVCGLQEIILQNLCGCQYCKYCWLGFIQSSIKSFNDPLPPCMTDKCLGKVSYLLALQLGKSNSVFNELFNTTLCRLYAQQSKFVKMCWADNCRNCFYVKSPSELTQCKQCMNYICLFCGKQYHNPGDCFNYTMWRKLSESSLDFIKEFGYRVCPKCKEAVDRSSGCNFMTCRCKNHFCYLCGENWEPNHKQHGTCYKPQISNQQRKKEIDNVLNEAYSTIKHIEAHRKLIEDDKKSYSLKIRQTQASISRYQNMIKKVISLNVEAIKKDLYQVCEVFHNQLYFLGHWGKVLHLGLQYCKSSMISIFIHPNPLLQFHIKELEININQIYQFFFEVLPNVITFTREPKTPFSYNDKKKMLKYIEDPKGTLEQKQKNCLAAINKSEKYLQLQQMNKFS